MLRRWREKVVLPEFLAPQTKAMGGGEAAESYAMASAASDHSSGMNISGESFSVSSSTKAMAFLSQLLLHS